MPREFARFNLSIWKDPDWRSLPAAAQHLYMLLWSHPQLSYCGVVDWRPGRLAALAGDLTTAEVETLGRCLEARLFLVVDPDTEEALIRSWARWDGLMRQPRMAVSFANAYSAVASRTIQAVIVHETLKLRGLEPNLFGWDKSVVQELLAAESLDPRERTLPVDPFPLGLGAVSEAFGANAFEGLGPVSVAPTTATATSTTPLLPATPTSGPSGGSGKSPRKRGSRVPASFAIDDAMRAWAKEKAPDVELAKATDEFVDHWTGVAGKAGVKLDWTGTWRNWIRRRQTWIDEKKPKTPTADDRDQWRFR